MNPHAYKNRKNLPTLDLRNLAHDALRANRWSEARALLDELSLRDDNPWSFEQDARGYECDKPLMAGYHAIIDDRIALCNARAERCREEREAHS